MRSLAPASGGPGSHLPPTGERERGNSEGEVNELEQLARPLGILGQVGGEAVALRGAGASPSPFSPLTYREQCRLSPTTLRDWLQDQASVPARVGYEARWGANYALGSGLPLEWFDGDQQRHISAHRMDNIPTMFVLAHRSSHRNTVLDTTCLLCRAQPETAPHLWACSAQSHEWRPAHRRLAE